MTKESRPDLLDVRDSKQFLSWYWLKSEMLDFCRANHLPLAGRKFELRDRIVSFLDGEAAPCDIASNRPAARKASSDFDWAKADLTLDTRITDSVTFGKNLRGFMREVLGSRFVCHSDFMDWVRANEGATLAQAAEAWTSLEARKKTPGFKRKIAPGNMLAQYSRDFFADNPGCSHKQMMLCWQRKRRLPAQGGRVIYQRSDRQWLSSAQ